MHAGSTAADVGAKDYVIASQHHVLASHLARVGIDDRFEVVRSPHFPVSPDWWIRRRRANAPALSLVIVATDPGSTSVSGILDRLGGYPLARIWLTASRDEDGRVRNMAGSLRRERPDLNVQTSIGALTAALARAAEDRVPLISIADASVEPRTDEWMWEMIGLKEGFPDAVVIGGRILDSADVVLSGPHVFGYDPRVGSPDQGRAATDAGYFGASLKQQSTSAVDARLCAVDPAFIQTLSTSGGPANLEGLGQWLGLAALQQNRRVVFSPFIEAVALRPRLVHPTPAPDLPSDTRYYHRLLSRSEPFGLADPAGGVRLSPAMNVDRECDGGPEGTPPD